MKTLLDVYVGAVLEFSYPTDNRIQVSTRLLRRRFVIERIRDCLTHPIEPWAIERRPDLRRGRILMIGRDLDRNDRRQFYLSSARSIRQLNLPLSQLAFFHPTRSNVPLKFFGPLWTDSKSDQEQIRQVINQVNETLNARGRVIRCVGLFPFQGGRNVDSRQSA